MPMAAVIPAVASIGSAAIGAIGSKGQKGAVDQGARISAEALAEAGRTSQAAFAQGRNDLMPWTQTGTAANTAGADLLGLHGQGAADAAFGNYRTSPGYQFQLSEGLRGVDAGAAAKGMLRSGATLKAEQEFGAGLADSDFQQYYKNLMGLSDSGLRAAGGQAQLGANQSNAAIDLARLSSGAALGSANATSSIYGNTAQGLGAGINDLFSNKDVVKGISGLFSGGRGYNYSDPLNSNS